MRHHIFRRSCCASPCPLSFPDQKWLHSKTPFCFQPSDKKLAESVRPNRNDIRRRASGEAGEERWTRRCTDTRTKQCSLNVSVTSRCLGARRRDVVPTFESAGQRNDRSNESGTRVNKHWPREEEPWGNIWAGFLVVSPVLQLFILCSVLQMELFLFSKFLLFYYLKTVVLIMILLTTMSLLLMSSRRQKETCTPFMSAFSMLEPFSWS